MTLDSAVGFENFCSRPKFERSARAESPAACRGGGGPQSLDAGQLLYLRLLRRSFCAPILRLWGGSWKSTSGGHLFALGVRLASETLNQRDERGIPGVVFVNLIRKPTGQSDP